MADGGMPERPNGAVSKTVVSSNGHRGFKSHSLRHTSRAGRRHVTSATRVHRRRRGAWTISLAALVVALLAPAAVAKTTKADVAIQKQAVLRKTDLPAGWKSSPGQPSSLPADP